MFSILHSGHILQTLRMEMEQSHRTALLLVLVVPPSRAEMVLVPVEETGGDGEWNAGLGLGLCTDARFWDFVLTPDFGTLYRD